MFSDFIMNENTGAPDQTGYHYSLRKQVTAVWFFASLTAALGITGEK